MSATLARAREILRAACGDRVRPRLAMAPLTTFRLGGPAALYLEPERDDDLVAAGSAVIETGLPFVVIGKGSNILVSDEGFDGLVLRLGRGYRWTARDGDRLRAGGSMPLPALAGVALRHGLAGLAFGVAIPATLGGAVKMNAGAHGHAISEVVERVEVFRLLEGDSRPVEANGAGFSYRRSALPDDGVVTAATVSLTCGAPESIREEMHGARQWRRRTQPLAAPSCGSVFKNPDGDHAARLIEASGAKGMRAGGAAVSTKHANFIVVDPAARATDVWELIRAVRERVEAATGVRLEIEVQLIGRFACHDR